MIRTMPRGGKRAGAGRRSLFPGNDLKPFAMDFTPAGRKVLDGICRRTKLSRNDVITYLVSEHGDALVLSAEGVVYPGKAQAVLTIRMPTIPGAVLMAAHARTGKSYSDIGEALVREYGPLAQFPTL